MIWMTSIALVAGCALALVLRGKSKSIRKGLALPFLHTVTTAQAGSARDAAVHIYNTIMRNEHCVGACDLHHTGHEHGSVRSKLSQAAEYDTAAAFAVMLPAVFMVAYAFWAYANAFPA